VVGLQGTKSIRLERKPFGDRKQSSDSCLHVKKEIVSLFLESVGGNKLATQIITQVEPEKMAKNASRPAKHSAIVEKSEFIKPIVEERHLGF
jgi:hypothetical protein